MFPSSGAETTASREALRRTLNQSLNEVLGDVGFDGNRVVTVGADDERALWAVEPDGAPCQSSDGHRGAESGRRAGVAAGYTR